MKGEIHEEKGERVEQEKKGEEGGREGRAKEEGRDGEEKGKGRREGNFAPTVISKSRPLWHGVCCQTKGAITSKIKHAIKHKTRLAQLLQPSLAFCFSLQPMMAHWTVRRHWLQGKTKC